MAGVTRIALGDAIGLTSDGAVVCDGRPATEADVAIRDDLPLGHPLRGARALRSVPSGWGDCTVAEGRLQPIDLKAIQTEPVEEEVSGVK